jgi:ATP-dependent helicase/nuclease subunit A
VLLLYGQSYKPDRWKVVRRDAGIELLYLNDGLAALDPELADLQAAEKSRVRVDRLNTLYVALTRAKRELYVIGARGKRDAFPFDLLPETGFEPREDKGEAKGEPRTDVRTARLVHVSHAESPVAAGTRLSYEDRRRGRFLHRILELVVTTADLAAALREAADRAAREDRSGAAITVPDLAAVLHRLGLADAFAPRAGREVFTERDVCDGDGRVHRMDRLVVDPDRVRILDWKSGGEEIGTIEQLAQVRAYADIVRQVFPGRSVEALLVHLDRLETRSVP